MNLKELIKKFIPSFVLSVYHYKLALLGAFLFGFPGLDKNLKIIGVTGTSGKSTTVDFITRILEESGAKVASISSIRFKIGEKEWENKYKMTMPGRFVIQGFLRQACLPAGRQKTGCRYVVLEVTSEGIKQFRHKFINFDTVVFTNLSKEHVEAHGSFENYRNAKLGLFEENKNVHVINIADENAEYFWGTGAGENIGYKIKNQKSKIKNTNQKSKILEAENIIADENGLSFQILNSKFQIPLMGEFNVYNALAAIAVAKNYGIDFEACQKALEKAKAIPGRMEIIQKEPFMVVVDYAHTPEQLESVYKTLYSIPYTLNPKLICVLGSCGGGRDKWKRPVLGKIAGQYCGQIIITNEDPYDENPLKIMDEIESGFSQIRNPKHEIRNYEKILDRQEAIKKAIQMAKPNNVVVITGKGSEPWMCVANGEKVPWDDRKIAKEACLPSGGR